MFGANYFGPNFDGISYWGTGPGTGTLAPLSLDFTRVVTPVGDDGANPMAVDFTAAFVPNPTTS